MKFLKGIVFYGKWFPSRGIEVVSVEGNDLNVKIHSERAGNHWFETWNLTHTIVGFRHGDYFVPRA